MTTSASSNNPKIFHMITVFSYFISSNHLSLWAWRCNIFLDLQTWMALLMNSMCPPSIGYGNSQTHGNWKSFMAPFLSKNGPHIKLSWITVLMFRYSKLYLLESTFHDKDSGTRIVWIVNPSKSCSSGWEKAMFSSFFSVWNLFIKRFVIGKLLVESIPFFFQMWDAHWLSSNLFSVKRSRERSRVGFQHLQCLCIYPSLESWKPTDHGALYKSSSCKVFSHQDVVVECWMLGKLFVHVCIY